MQWNPLLGNFFISFILKNIFFAWLGAEGTLPPVKLLQNGRHVHEHAVIGAPERNGSVSVIQNLRGETLNRMFRVTFFLHTNQTAKFKKSWFFCRKEKDRS
jgi:hypothetical protein